MNRARGSCRPARRRTNRPNTLRARRRKATWRRTRTAEWWRGEERGRPSGGRSDVATTNCFFVVHDLFEVKVISQRSCSNDLNWTWTTGLRPRLRGWAGWAGWSRCWVGCVMAAGPAAGLAAGLAVGLAAGLAAGPPILSKNKLSL